MSHFINIKQLSKSQLTSLLRQAQNFIAQDSSIAEHDLLKNKIVANLFFENSTRTRCSFEIAAKKLGAHVLNLDINTSSANKGESLFDTIANLLAMGVTAFVIRHSDNGIMQQIAGFLEHKASLINAGEGSIAHPTQGLLDVLTIQQNKKIFDDLVCVIVGDLKHSRVARSQIEALDILGVKEIRLVAPESLLPVAIPFLSHAGKVQPGCPPLSQAGGDSGERIKIFTDFNSALQNADVITMLRIQKERMDDNLIVDINNYINYYQLNAARLRLAKPDAIVMHPGPMNREVEITSEVADGPQSAILQQARNGVAVRMAVLKQIITRSE